MLKNNLIQKQNMYTFQFYKQVAQWATTAHLVAIIMFGDTIIYESQKQVTLNLKQ